MKIIKKSLNVFVFAVLIMLFSQTAYAKEPTQTMFYPFFDYTPKLIEWEISARQAQTILGEPNDKKISNGQTTLIYYYNKVNAAYYTFNNDSLSNIRSTIFVLNNSSAAINEYKRLYDFACEAFSKQADFVLCSNNDIKITPESLRFVKDSSISNALLQGTSWRSDWFLDSYNCSLILEKVNSNEFAISVIFSPSGKTEADIKQDNMEQNVLNIQALLKEDTEKAFTKFPWDSRPAALKFIGEPTNQVKQNGKTQINFISDNGIGLEFFYKASNLYMIMSKERANISKQSMMRWYPDTLSALHSQFGTPDTVFFGKDNQVKPSKINYSPLAQTVEEHFMQKDELQIIWNKQNYKISLIIAKSSQETFTCFLFYEKP